jgi:hypothetical protein
MDLNTNLSRSQASKLLSRRVLPKSAKAGVLKATTQKVQAATMMSDAIEHLFPELFHCRAEFIRYKNEVLPPLELEMLRLDDITEQQVTGKVLTAVMVDNTT